MDISVLPNNNHPDKFLQLDVGMLPAAHGMFQVGVVMSSQRLWQNRVYLQREQRVNTDSWSPPSPEGTPVVFESRYLEKHITPVTLKSNIKRNPLYMDIRSMEAVDNNKSKPSWTVKEYDTQTIHGNLADYLKKTPKDLDFWLEDLYTPGFDSLLKKKEAENKRKRLSLSPYSQFPQEKG
ncbi:major intrinsically disordered NOTCH2-binding receptor 1-like homolog [Plectropomus leopardus]|uniref:major intrinsically disordered NOTCH2-binding receptor 1-like homolog n=1 Tax=Plectropomus leopardus TaxID=160734 RepID=UPI001C4D92B7|nr:major intrinsically disordered NOTCH2-binding receptor 1-like homolog [Plectropomus leopardus]